MGIFQIFIGVALGLVALVLINKNARITNEPHNSRRGGHNSSRRRSSSGYHTKIGENCVICLEEMEERDIHYFSCHHALHDKCYKLYKRQNKTCPICRKPDTSSI